MNEHIVATLNGRTAVVTGASSGIGAEIARDLARRGCNLVLTARREDRLAALARELSDQYSITASVIALDLSEPGGAAELVSRCDLSEISILVNNAGFGDFHHFSAIAETRVANMVQLNVTTVLELCHAFIGAFCKRDERAYVLNVGSMVAWMPIAHFATYCGTKSFVRNFSESLSAELKGTNVSVTCLSPGGTRTEFVEVAGQKIPAFAEKSLMSAQRCARIGVKSMLRGKRNVVPGVSNKLMVFLTRFFPRRVVGGIAHSLLGEVPTASVDSSGGGE